MRHNQYQQQNSVVSNFSGEIGHVIFDSRLQPLKITNNFGDGALAAENEEYPSSVGADIFGLGFCILTIVPICWSINHRMFRVVNIYSVFGHVRLSVWFAASLVIACHA